MTYQVYSLEGRPKLLKTLTGGSYYNTQDVRLEDRNEIWTDDAVAIDGFENLPLASYDLAPMVVLRFEKRRLLDVSSEYQSYFDQRIGEVRAQLDAQALDRFKRSDGKLSPSAALPARDLRQLESTKVKVLEIVWSYLYSGREDEAWRTLSEMWPPGDVERVRAALENLRSRGILREVDGSVSKEHRPPWKRHAVLFDMVTVTHQMLDGEGGVIAVPDDPALVSSGHPGEETLTTVDTGPQAIYLGLPAAKDGGQPLSSGKVYLNLVVDAAGKVRSARLESPIRGDPAGAAELAASASWNFIPAFRSGRAVACRIRMGVSPQQ